MAQHDLLRAGLRQLHRRSGRIVVGEMTAAGENPLLQIVGIRPRLKHVRIIVGFQQHRVRTGHVLHPPVSDTAQIGGQRKPRRVQLEQISH